MDAEFEAQRKRQTWVKNSTTGDGHKMIGAVTYGPNVHECRSTTWSGTLLNVQMVCTKSIQTEVMVLPKILICLLEKMSILTRWIWIGL
jgi:hypothetical protein